MITQALRCGRVWIEQTGDRGWSSQERSEILFVRRPDGQASGNRASTGDNT
jgi:hypothetical protein